jgi:hypothetical protein
MAFNLSIINKPKLELNQGLSFSPKSIMKMKINRIQETKNLEHERKLQELKQSTIPCQLGNVIPQRRPSRQGTDKCDLTDSINITETTIKSQKPRFAIDMSTVEGKSPFFFLEIKS